MNPLAFLPPDYPVEGKVILRLYDWLDGWVDTTGEIQRDEAVRLWNERTYNGTRMACYEHGDYFAIFPAGTRMLATPESRGR